MGRSPLESLRSRREAAETLLDETRVLQDARFLGALHAELAEHLGADEAALTLIHVGLYQGLRDATRLLQQGFLARGADAGGPPTAPLLAMRLATPASPTRGALAVHGSWPEQNEACARVSTLGASAEPACFVSTGYTSGWLSGLFELDLLALETSCAARGEIACEFAARELEAWRHSGDARAGHLLREIDFPGARAYVADEVAHGPRRALETAFDPASPAVHVWGPVMVIPFSGAEASLHAVELIRSDPAAAGVLAVVVDLGQILLDEGLGALALERLLEAVYAAGAEPILTGVSPICMPVVAGLEQRRVLIEKDLPQAIATAFQIAEAQRRAL